MMNDEPTYRGKALGDCRKKPKYFRRRSRRAILALSFSTQEAGSLFYSSFSFVFS